MKVNHRDLFKIILSIAYPAYFFLSVTMPVNLLSILLLPSLFLLFNYPPMVYFNSNLFRFLSLFLNFIIGFNALRYSLVFPVGNSFSIIFFSVMFSGIYAFLFTAFSSTINFSIDEKIDKKSDDKDIVVIRSEGLQSASLPANLTKATTKYEYVIKDMSDEEINQYFPWFSTVGYNLIEDILLSEAEDDKLKEVGYNKIADKLNSELTEYNNIKRSELSDIIDTI